MYVQQLTKEASIINKKTKTKEEHIQTLLNIASVLCFVVAIVLVLVLILSRNPSIQLWYNTYKTYLLEAEHAVETMGDKASIFVVILFLYTFKAVFPLQFYPLSALCAITSTVFEPYFSIPINIMGLVIMFTIRYYWGRRVGSDAIQSILNKSVTIKTIIENDGKGNPWLLSVFRLIPSMPPNVISKLYGAMGFRYRDFILLSLLGFAPQLISYTFIGSNVFNPLSAAFLVPFILLFVLIGISTLAVGKVLQVQNRRKKSNG